MPQLRFFANCPSPVSERASWLGWERDVLGSSSFGHKSWRTLGSFHCWQIVAQGLALAVTIVLFVAGSSFAQGQVIPVPGGLGAIGRGAGYPSQQYYLALEVYRSGDLANAIEGFDGALGQSRLDGDGRWIDAIPSLAMLAECHWQLGNLPMAMSNIEAALQLAVRHRGWLSRVDFSSALTNAVRTPDSNSGWASTGNLKLLAISSRISVQRGEVLTEQRIAQGGTIESINVVSMDVAEVIRTLAVALHRRRIILGEMSKDSQLSAEVLDATKYPQDLNVPIGRTLIGAVRMAGRYNDLDDARALSEASETATLGGSIHPLTPIVLLCQAEVLAASARPTDAVPIALQAAQCAAALGHNEWVGESLALALGCCDRNMIANVRTLAMGAAGAYGRDGQSTTLAALLVAAEASILAGDTTPANALVQQAQAISGRRGFTNPRWTAYGAYVTALLGAASGQSLTDVNGSIQAALAAINNFTTNQRFRNKVAASNPSLYQLSSVLGSSRPGALDQQTEKRLRYHLNDPPATLWRRDPVEAIGWLMQDRTAIGSMLLSHAIASSDPKTVLIETDAFLRSAFANALPLSGRLQSIRTLATAAPDRLAKDASDFLKQPPVVLDALRKASAQAKQAALAEPTSSNAVHDLESQATLAMLSRQTYPTVILPSFDFETFKRVPDRTGLLVFTVAGNQVIATLAASDSVVTWSAGTLAQVSISIGKLLKEIGVGQPRSARQGDADTWRTLGAELRRQLLAETSFDASRFDDLIVVPAGPLWYLPLELLPAGGEEAALIGERIRVRYAPTPGLALQPAPLAPIAVASDPEAGETAISATLFFAPSDAQVNTDAIQSIVDVATGVVRLPLTPPVPSGWLSPTVKHLLVAEPRAIDSANALAFVISETDKNSPEGSLRGWLAFPNHGPASVILPGFRTPVGSGRLGDGSELFMSLTALHVAGVRDVMLSRWAVGGQSTALVLREFVQELPHLGMLAAWQRAVMLLREATLDPEAEPLLGKADREKENFTGDAPLLWSSYLIAAPAPLKPN
jgi:hypothetical protein